MKMTVKEGKKIVKTGRTYKWNTEDFVVSILYQPPSVIDSSMCLLLMFKHKSKVKRF